MERTIERKFEEDDAKNKIGEMPRCEWSPLRLTMPRANSFSFDFIGLAERHDESVVALSLLLGLDLADIAHASQKTFQKNPSVTMLEQF